MQSDDDDGDDDDVRVKPRETVTLCTCMVWWCNGETDIIREWKWTQTRRKLVIYKENINELFEGDTKLDGFRAHAFELLERKAYTLDIDYSIFDCRYSVTLGITGIVQ